MDITPNMIFSAIVVSSMIVAIYILTRIYIKRAYQATRIYKEFDDE